MQKTSSVIIGMSAPFEVATLKDATNCLQRQLARAIRYVTVPAEHPDALYSISVRFEYIGAQNNETLNAVNRFTDWLNMAAYVCGTFAVSNLSMDMTTLPTGARLFKNSLLLFRTADSARRIKAVEIVVLLPDIHLYEQNEHGNARGRIPTLEWKEDSELRLEERLKLHRWIVLHKVLRAWRMLRRHLLRRTVAFYWLGITMQRHCEPGGKCREEDKRKFCAWSSQA